LLLPSLIPLTVGRTKVAVLTASGEAFPVTSAGGCVGAAVLIVKVAFPFFTEVALGATVASPMMIVLLLPSVMDEVGGTAVASLMMIVLLLPSLIPLAVGRTKVAVLTTAGEAFPVTSDGCVGATVLIVNVAFPFFTEV
jgi:hypothetical protein